MISFDCPHCGKNLKTKDDKAGMKSRCPGCQEVVQIPASDHDEGDNPYSYDRDDEESSGMKDCPACGESIKSEAIKCKHCGESFGGGAKRRSRGASKEYAGFWLRFCAMFIDGIICNIIQFAVGFVLGFVFMAAMGQGNNQDALVLLQVVSTIVGMIIQFLYFAIQESSEAQATIGKRALGIIVTDIDGRRLTFGRATGRHFAKIISSFTCIIGFIMAGFTEKRQALHDIIASCLVVKK